MEIFSDHDIACFDDFFGKINQGYAQNNFCASKQNQCQFDFHEVCDKRPVCNEEIGDRTGEDGVGGQKSFE